MGSSSSGENIISLEAGITLAVLAIMASFLYFCVYKGSEEDAAIEASMSDINKRALEARDDRTGH